jgi:hypothetical protein
LRAFSHPDSPGGLGRLRNRRQDDPGLIKTGYGRQGRFGLIAYRTIKSNILRGDLKHKADAAATGDQTLHQTGVNKPLARPRIDQLVQYGQNIATIWIRHGFCDLHWEVGAHISQTTLAKTRLAYSLAPFRLIADY